MENDKINNISDVEDGNQDDALKNVEIDSESFQSNIGDPHRIVTLQGSAQVAGPEDNSNGLFVDGKSFFPDAPHILAWGHPFAC